VEDLEVDCELDERGEPVPRWLGRGARSRAIVELIDRWEGADHRYFRVRDDAGALLILRHDLRRGSWRLVALERAGGGTEAGPHV
jgi:hypothetical protein